MTPKLSIIIPCYNSQATLQLTLESVLNQSFQDWEAIIVNDGSTDNTEQIALNWIQRDQRFHYFSKENEGLGKTRNFAIRKAIGEYILPLDSDNLVSVDFAESAISIFENNSDIGVVHGNALYFGERQGIWKIGPYVLEKILTGNYIDACAIYKKALWEHVGGYDENMPFQGHEDWALWIEFGEKDVLFHYLDQITFHYHVAHNSMIRSFRPEMQKANQDYIAKKHSLLYQDYFIKKFHDYDNYRNDLEKKMNSEKFILNLLTKKMLGFKLFKL